MSKKITITVCEKNNDGQWVENDVEIDKPDGYDECMVALQELACDCESETESYYVEDNACDCSILKHHWHCEVCGGVTQIG